MRNIELNKVNGGSFALTKIGHLIDYKYPIIDNNELGNYLKLFGLALIIKVN